MRKACRCCTLWALWVPCVHELHEVAQMSTGNTAPLKESAGEELADLFARHPSAAVVFARNLIGEWVDQMTFLGKYKKKTVSNYQYALDRLLRSSKVLPWELRKIDVTNCLKSIKGRDGDAATPETVSVYCSAWRCFQSFLLDADRANVIAQTFKIRPQTFLNEENAIPIKRVKANWKPAGFALTPLQIDRVEDWFIEKITIAIQTNSKALYILLRDRVMFHIAIHFALRVSELVLLTLDQFKPSHDPMMRAYGDLGILTVIGKNNVTGSPPMREPAIHRLLVNHLENVRPVFLQRAAQNPNAPTMAELHEHEVLTSSLLFTSERGGMISPNTFRRRLDEISKDLCLPRKIKPHTLRHTGCTLMVPLYSPEVAQKYMRHKNLATTLFYYHPEVTNAGAHFETARAMALAYDEEDGED